MKIIRCHSVTKTLGVVSVAFWTANVSNLLRLGVIANRAKLIGGSVREQMPQRRSVFLQISPVSWHNACAIFNRILPIVCEVRCFNRGVFAGTSKTIQSRRGPHWFSARVTNKANNKLKIKDG
jgi:hypothetical protein